mgnify:CR=1 FL=1
MPERVLEIHALSPLLFRDGRPFSAADGTETAARSLPLPLPSTVAGFMRTQIGKAEGKGWSQEQLQNLHGLQVCGPLLARGQEILLPAPRDAVVYKDAEEKPQFMKLRPFTPEGTGCDLPEGMLPLEVTHDVKPEGGYHFWTASEMERWLVDENLVPEKNSDVASTTNDNGDKEQTKNKDK